MNQHFLLIAHSSSFSHILKSSLCKTLQMTYSLDASLEKILWSKQSQNKEGDRSQWGAHSMAEVILFAVITDLNAQYLKNVLLLMLNNEKRKILYKFSQLKNHHSTLLNLITQWVLTLLTLCYLTKKAFNNLSKHLSKVIQWSYSNSTIALMRYKVIILDSSILKYLNF